MTALEAPGREWAAATTMRADEMRAEGFSKAARHLESVAHRWQALLHDVSELRAETEPHGRKLARWQALMREAGFSWGEIRTLFAGVPAETDDAARKRVATLMRDEHEAAEIKRQFEEMSGKSGSPPIPVDQTSGEGECSVS